MSMDPEKAGALVQITQELLETLGWLPIVPPSLLPPPNAPWIDDED